MGGTTMVIAPGVTARGGGHHERGGLLLPRQKFEIIRLDVHNIFCILHCILNIENIYYIEIRNVIDLICTPKWFSQLFFSQIT